MVRIASLVPSATEIAWILGLEGQLVAVTHDCDFPPSVQRLPRLTSSTIPLHGSSSEIDGLVRAAADRGEGTFHVDLSALRAARPDVLLGQTICRVCAVTMEQLPPSGEAGPRAIPLSGASIEGIFADMRLVAEELGVPERGARAIDELRRRLGEVSRRVAGRERPRVACLEWLDPIFNAGHWVPDQVGIAGGTDVLGTTGERSRVLEWDEVLAAEPDVVVLMPCGFDAARGVAESSLITARPRFGDLSAARSGRVFAVDGGRYFSRPGPRVVEGTEILATLFHPELFPPPPPDRALQVVARST